MQAVKLRQLRYLVALADCAHFGRAAEQCHVSQPTLSTQIKRLEDYLRVPLIDRNSKPVSLTPTGYMVVSKSRRIIQEADGLLQPTRALEQALNGRLSLGIIPTLGPYLLPRLLPLLRHKHPQLQLVVHEDLTTNLLHRLRAQQIDAALLALPLLQGNLCELPLFDEPFWFACPPQHPLAGADSVNDEDLRDERLLLLADGHCLRGQALAACGRQVIGAAELDDFRAASLETICQLVAAGFGSTLLPALAASSAQLTRPFKTLPLRSPKDSRRIGLVWRLSHPDTEVLSLVAGTIRENPPEGTRPLLVTEAVVGSRGAAERAEHHTMSYATDCR
jgi:LysR family hydrogen peroxide-inducible transcriptional activator